MSSSNSKLWLVLSISGLVGIVGAIYAVKLIGKYSTEKVVTGQVDEYTKQWARARLCVAGDDATMARASDAFLLYEATNTRLRGRLGECDQFIRKLKRPGKESTGVARVEKSWDELRDATKKLTQAYVGLVDTATRRRMGPRRAKMVAALDGMDAAYAKLRADSSMSAPVLPGENNPAKLPVGVPVTVAGGPLMSHFVKVAGNTVSAYGQTADGRSHRVVMRGLDQVSVTPQSNSAEVAIDTALWGVWSDVPADNLAELRVGALGPDGEPHRPGALAVKASEPSMSLQVRAALGQGALRVVIYETLTASEFSEESMGLSMVRSTDGGATFGPPVSITEKVLWQSVTADPAGRRADITWADEPGAVYWLPVHADRLQALPPPRQVTAGRGESQPRMCLNGDASWWLVAGLEVHMVANAQAGTRRVQNSAGSLGDVSRDGGCTDKNILYESPGDGGTTLLTCDTRRCQRALEVPLASDSQHAILLTRDGAPLAVTQVNRMLVVWRPGPGPQVLLLAEPPAPASPTSNASAGRGDEGSEIVVRGLVEWDGVVHVVTAPASMPAGGAPVHLVALPAAAGE